MELEAKFEVDRDYNEELLAKGLKYKKDAHQRDNYYIVDYPYYLRLREDVKNGKYSLDFHENIKGVGAKETEISLNSLEDLRKMEYILQKLNLVVKCVVDKKRKVYVKEDFEVVFDEVDNLGRFVEVELEAENTKDNLDRLNKFAAELGLKEENKATKGGYPELCMRKNGIAI